MNVLKNRSGLHGMMAPAIAGLALVVVMAVGLAVASTITLKSTETKPARSTSTSTLKAFASPPGRVAPTSPPTQQTDAADAAVRGLIEVGNKVLAAPELNLDSVSAVATGFAEGELQSLATERRQQGYTQVGEAQVTSVSTQSMDLSASPPSITLAVCIDSSDIDVLDANGTSLKGLLYQAPGPVLNIYGAVFIDGAWRISTHEIPVDSTCTN